VRARVVVPCIAAILSAPLACGSSGSGSPSDSSSDASISSDSTAAGGDGAYAAIDAGDSAEGTGATGDAGDAGSSCEPGLDPGFGAAGGIEVPVPPNPSAAGGGAVAFDASGRILAFGHATSGSGSTGPAVALARYDSDGSSDATFGTGGVWTGTSMDVGTSELAVQPDGKILAAGGNFSAPGWFLLRVDSTGALDTSFGSAGYAAAPASNAYVAALAVRPDGHILTLSGQNGNGNGSPPWLLAQYDATGHLDPAFGANGVLSLPTPSWSTPAAAVLQSDGMLVAGGYGSNGPVLARVTTQGTLDPSFGAGGIATASLAQSGVVDLAIASSGRILAAALTPGFTFRVIAFTTAGALDTSFGTKGVTDTAFAGKATSQRLAIDSNDGVVTSGFVASQQADAGSPFAIAVTRYSASGSLDPTFGSGGRLIMPFPSGRGVPAAAALSAARGLAVTGYWFPAGPDGGQAQVLELARFRCLE